MNDEAKAWESYEEVASYLLNQMANEFDLQKFEGKQTIVGKRSGTKWEIDAKGVSKDNEVFSLLNVVDIEHQDKIRTRWAVSPIGLLIREQKAGLW